MRKIPEVITCAEAARLKGVSRQSIMEACDRGDLENYRSGWVRLVSRKSLDAWTPDPGQMKRWARLKEEDPDG